MFKIDLLMKGGGKGWLKEIHEFVPSHNLSIKVSILEQSEETHDESCKILTQVHVCMTMKKNKGSISFFHILSLQ